METSYLQLSCGRNISYRKSGESGPTVIFESGMTCDKEYWKNLQERLSDEHSTFSYDRSGLGNSDHQNFPKSLESVTLDLEELIEKLNVKPPFIFVGHSFGGFLSKHYSHHFSDSTAGVVFVDGSDSYFGSETLSYRTESQRHYWEKLGNRLDIYKSEAEVQEFRAFNNILESNKNIEIRNDIPTQILVCDNLTSWFDPDVDEYYSFDEAPKELLERDNNTWIECHKAWLEQAPNASLVIAENCSHSIHLDNEEYVYSAIRKTVQTGTSNKTL